MSVRKTNHEKNDENKKKKEFDSIKPVLVDYERTCVASAFSC